MVQFDCTMCGRCCHGLRLPLSLAEAMGWLRDGHDVQLFCEAIPWPSEPPEDNLPAMHKRRRSFEAMSGTLPVRVIATLMASFDGPCPNLQPDMRCGIYDRRPATCRIYPAEVNPFIRLDPAVKLCPPEAWQGETTILADDGRWANADLAATIVCARDADAYDAVLKRQLCAALGCATAALSNEGMVIFSPSREAALAALSDTLGSDGDERLATDMSWQLVSNRSQTLGALLDSGSSCATPATMGAAGLSYLGYFETEVA
ncbi:YkgJ family cysteine cluster protein [Luteibacter sp. ME-Dv--P-043b]|jgi:Fe-S-cluster containining protein|uniref:YkgJ family cysteine cluster protein n=1 Tax=unclassified Luteibacter TaxID=2620188 RepID=UPI002556FA72|nr:YkgJ family cysteine cluster protein [Luteibacter sp. ME-Dv--P-043b]